MEPSQLRPRARLKVTFVCLVLAALAGSGWFLRLRLAPAKITDRALLREAVDDWKRAGEPDYGPNPQIFEQQAAQGYYEDAAATGHLFKSPDEVQWSVVELAKIRAENGDAQGALAAIHTLKGTSLGERATRTIALAQASNGDMTGALATASEVHATDDVLMILARRQIDAADFDGALQTSERMSPNAASQLFYDVGEGLCIRHQQERVGELASHMHNRKYAKDFRQNVRFTLWDPVPVRTIQTTPCDMAPMYAAEGKFALADRTIEQNKCPVVSFVAVRQYLVDPIGAERLLRSTTSRDDLIFGLNQFAIAAAEKGDVAEVKRFLSNTAETGGGIVSGGTVQAVARAWTIRDGPKTVLPWARSRLTLDQRTWALIGVAEALGHAKHRN